jgi:hypothetical protein
MPEKKITPKQPKAEKKAGETGDKAAARVSKKQRVSLKQRATLNKR